MEKFYMEQPKKIPIKSEVEVLVVGGGPAGFAAAIQAARLGASTMLIEQTGAIGGIATSGLMSHWTGSINSSIYDEITSNSAKMNEGEFKDKKTHLIDPDKLKLLMLKMLKDAGVAVQLYTFASDVIMENKTLKGVITESKSGRAAIMAKAIIDASGDGDIAAKSGTPFILGRESDGKMQPVTMMFKVAGVDYDKAVFLESFESTYETPKGELQQLAREHLPQPAGHVLLYKSTLPSIVTCNMTNCINIDGTKAEDLTKAEFICRTQAEEIIKFLRKFVPGYENCFMISTASLMGVRETRHFKGEYTITEDDIYAAKRFDDWVVADAQFNFDVHNITGAGLDETGLQHGFKQKLGYTIPYGCLVPVETENLLLAGRNISGTHMAHSNYRAMPICVGMGQAAGIAAWICAKNGISPRMVNAKDIQTILIQEGVTA